MAVDLDALWAQTVGNSQQNNGGGDPSSSSMPTPSPSQQPSGKPDLDAIWAQTVGNSQNKASSSPTTPDGKPDLNAIWAQTMGGSQQSSSTPPASPDTTMPTSPKQKTNAQIAAERDAPITNFFGDVGSAISGGARQLVHGLQEAGNAGQKAADLAGAKPMEGDPYNNPEHQNQPLNAGDVATQAYKGVGDVLGGGMQAGFAPQGAALNAMGPVGDVAKGVLSIPQNVAGAGVMQIGKTLGVKNLDDPNSQEYKDFQEKFVQPTQNILNAYLAAHPEALTKPLSETGEALGRQSAIDQAYKSGDINAIEKATSAPAPTAVGNVGAGLVNAAKDVGGAVSDLAGKAGGVLGEIPKQTLSQVSGLKPDTLSAATQNPEALSAARAAGSDVVQQNVFDKAKSSIDQKISDLSETGSGYKEIRAENAPVKIPDTFLNDFLKSKGLSVEEGQITANADSVIRSPNEIARLQSLYDTYEGKTTGANSFLNLRQDTGDLAKFGEGITSNLTGAAKDLYSKINDAAREQVPGLKELDTQFKPQIEELKGVKNLIYKPDGSLKDNAQNTVNNLLNKANTAKLGRLEEVSPGITQDLKILKAVQNIEKPGSFMKALTEGGMALSGHGYAAVATHLFTHPAVIIPILETYGRLAGKSAEFIDGITESLKEGLPPKGASASFINSALKNVNPNALAALTQANAGLFAKEQKK